jgi:hypothetical protein
MTAERASSSRLATAVFVGLVLATVGAFFVIQRLKRATPVATKIHLQRYVSPNGDGRLDRAVIGFRLPKADDSVTVSITDANGDEVRRLADRRLRKGRHRFHWNGRDGSAAIVPDGFYYLRVVLNGEGRGSFSRDGVQVITKAPQAKLVSVTPARIPPGARQGVTIRFDGPARPPALVSVYRTDRGPARLVTRFNAPPGSHTAVWDARIAGRPAPPGTYAFGVTVLNVARVAGSSPPHLPPAEVSAAPHTGVTIAGIEAAPPHEALRAGSTAMIGLGGARGKVRWTLRAPAAKKPLGRGRTSSEVLTLRVPRKARTGLYLVRLRAPDGTRATVPLAVRGRHRGRVLVVLPAITWQGRNPVDEDSDGFPNTLDNSSAVFLDSHFARGRLPAGVATTIEPLLRFLDANHLPYDLTTDFALSRGVGPQFDHRPAVVFAGDERWFTEPLDARLRRYVEAGGRVASFGTDSFRRTVALTSTLIENPSPPQETNALGEQTAPTSSAAAPLVVNPGDSLGLFAGSDGFVGLFTRFEESRRRVSGANLQASAGRDPDHPAFVAYQLGDGLVVRTGTPEWSKSLATDPEVARVTTNLWSLLSR